MSGQDNGALRQYIVSVPVRCVQEYRVMAASAADAKRRVEAGQGEPDGWDTHSEGRPSRAVLAGTDP